MSYLDRMTDRLAGLGLRPALVLATCFVGPTAYAVAALLARRIEGFPTLVVSALTLLVALLGTAMTSDDAQPDIADVLRRGAILAVAAILVGLFTPSLGESLSAIATRWTSLFSTPFLPVLLLLLLAHATGHGVAARVALFVDGRRTKQTDRLREENLLLMWLVAASTTVAAIGLGGAATDGFVAWLAVAAMGVSGLTIAHLRAMTPHADGRRPAIVVAPLRPRRVAVAGAAAVVALLAVIGVALLPPAITEASPRLVAWLSQYAGEVDTPPVFSPPDAEGAEVSEGGDEGGELDDTAQRERVGEGDLPLWPFPVIAGALLVWLAVWVIRGGRWREIWAAILEWLRATSGGTGRDERDDPVDELERDASSRSAWSERLDRFRPRPRDPRGAILHDYLRAERALARHDVGRDGWETLFEHAARLGLGAQHRELAELASDARYGRPEPSTDAAVRSRELARTVIRTVKDHRPTDEPVAP